MDKLYSRCVWLQGLIFRRWQSIFIFLAFLLNALSPFPCAQAQELRLPAPGIMVQLSPEFTPAHLKGMIIHPENPLKFDFLITRGDEILTPKQKHDTYQKLIKYFLASLAVPDEDQWVNLSPYEKDRIIRDDFGKTEMGRDLLAQDYMLKQITASLIYPEGNLGRKFWDRVYSEAQERYGTTNIPVNTFNKVWIIPDSAYVYEHGNMVYVVNQHLKVMLEEDYLSLKKHSGVNGRSLMVNGQKQNKNTTSIHQLGSKIIRAIILPALEKEVNEGKNFAMLRQVYSGMILAAWYKYTLKKSFLGQIYADRAKLKGVDQDPKNNVAIYKEYLKAFKKGVFNYIKEDVNKYTSETIPRKYFSGGEVDPGMKGYFEEHIAKPASLSMVLRDPAMQIGRNGLDEALTRIVELEPAHNGHPGPAHLNGAAARLKTEFNIPGVVNDPNPIFTNEQENIMADIFQSLTSVPWQAQEIDAEGVSKETAVEGLEKVQFQNNFLSPERIQRILQHTRLGTGIKRERGVFLLHTGSFREKGWLESFQDDEFFKSFFQYLKGKKTFKSFRKGRELKTLTIYIEPHDNSPQRYREQSRFIQINFVLTPEIFEKVMEQLNQFPAALLYMFSKGKEGLFHDVWQRFLAPSMNGDRDGFHRGFYGPFDLNEAAKPEGARIVLAGAVEKVLNGMWIDNMEPKQKVEVNLKKLPDRATYEFGFEYPIWQTTRAGIVRKASFAGLKKWDGQKLYVKHKGKVYEVTKPVKDGQVDVTEVLDEIWKDHPGEQISRLTLVLSEISPSKDLFRFDLIVEREPELLSPAERDRVRKMTPVLLALGHNGRATRSPFHRVPALVAPIVVPPPVPAPLRAPILLPAPKLLSPAEQDRARVIAPVLLALRHSGKATISPFNKVQALAAPKIVRRRRPKTKKTRPVSYLRLFEKIKDAQMGGKVFLKGDVINNESGRRPQSKANKREWWVEVKKVKQAKAGAGELTIIDIVYMRKGRRFHYQMATPSTIPKELAEAIMASIYTKYQKQINKYYFELEQLSDMNLKKSRAAEKLFPKILETINKTIAGKAGVNRAMKDLGGIDFNAAHLNLKIGHDGRGVPLPLSQQDMAQINSLEGLEPVILEIRPASMLPFFSQLQGKSTPASA